MRPGVSRSLAPDSLTTLPQRGISSLISAANCSGVPPAASAPSSPSFLRSSGCLQRLVELGVQLGDHVLRRAGRRQQAEPGDGVEALVARLVDRRHVGQVVDALGRRDGQRAQLALLDLAEQRRHRGHVELDVAADHVGQRLVAPLYGTCCVLTPAAFWNSSLGQVGHGAVARRGEVQRARAWPWRR